MIKHLRVINMAVGLVFACASMAQTMTSLPYNMSFEASEVAELQNWHFNTGSEAANCSDQWMVGTDQQSDGKRSLYISDNGSTAHFGAAHNVQFAYRDFLLPQGSYIVSFDWKNMGAPNATLYVGFGRTTSLPCEASSTTGVLTQAYISASQHAQLRGQRYWQNARLTGVNSNGTRAIRIFFAWCSDNQDTTWMNPLGACIDNIEIRKANFAPPTSLNIDASCDTTYVTWTGTCDSYQLEYKKSGDALWHSRSGLYASGGTGNLILEQLQEGMYDFRIRGFYGTDVSTRDTTVYTYANSYFVFCPDNHCINYVNLHDTTGSVVCHYGHINSSGVIDQTSTGVIDNGPNSVSSRHTVNWDLDAYDSRTHNQLPLVPIGEFASVRLGNWNDGGEWESVTYNYLVDSAYAILLLKYAVVLEDPGHDKEDQPRFTLSIKDEFGQEVDPECGSADFYAGRNSGNKGGGWHYEPDLSWKEWTTYGVDLTQYIGQSLQITVTTYDCTWQGHYGYAYFCLGCAKAKIETLSCGDDSKMTAQAPDGFAYEWRSIHNMDTVVSYERTLEVDASDTTTYICKLTYLDQEECFFELRSSVLPRFPVAFYSYKYEPTNCENRVVFNNLSHIVVKYEGDPQGTHHWDEPCEEYEWVINNERFSDVNPIYIFPQEGGRFPVSLFASISDGKCTDDTTFYVDVPTIGDVVLNIDQEICYGSSFTLGSKTYNTSGVYSETFESRAGCDSTCILNLTVLPQNLTNLPDTSICAESVYMLDGDVYPFEKTGQWIRHKFNVHGCDSTIIQYVTVMDTIKPSIDVTPIIEDGDLGSVKVTGTGYTYYTVNGTRHEASEHLITGLTPNDYLLIFYNDIRCEKALSFSLDQGCVANFVYQRWNDVLSVKNPTYANGRSYETYQWLENGQPIEGATKSYYYAPDGLNVSSVYEVLLTDSLGHEYISCAYHPIQLISDEISVSPSNVQSGGNVWIQSGLKAWVECYNTSGVKIFAQSVDSGRTSLEMPMLSGMYIITVYTECGKRSFRICVTE